YAVERGHKALAELLLNNGADPNAVDHKGMSALCLAIDKWCNDEDTQLNLLELLLRNVNNNSSTASPTSIKPMQVVLASGSLEALQLLLNHGFQLDDSNEVQLPLHVAALNPDARMLEYLLETGIFDVEQRDELGFTVFHQAVACNNLAQVSLLLSSYRVNFNCLNERGESPLYTAVKRGFAACVELLLSHGVDVNEGGPDRRHLPFQVVLECDDSTWLKMFLERGVDLADCGIHLPLHVAVVNPDVRVLQHLVNSGCFDLETKDDNGYTALHQAVHNNLTAAVELLLDSGADPNTYNKIGQPVLHSAASKGHFDIVELLLEQGARADFGGPDGRYLPFEATLKYGTLEAVKLFLNQGINLDDCGGVNFPLHLAASNPKSEVLSFLLSSGAFCSNWDDGKDKLRDDEGNSGLQIAVRHDHHDNLRLLLDWGEDVENKNEVGDTPLHEAIRNRCVDCVTTLLHKRADVRAKNSQGISILKEAFKTNESEMIETVIKALVKAEAQCLDVEREDLDLVESSRFEKYYKSCKDELELMSSSTIFDDSVKISDIAIGDRVGHYAKMDGLTDGVDLDDLKKQFPIYGGYVYEVLYQIKRVHEAINKGYDAADELDEGQSLTMYNSIKLIESPKPGNFLLAPLISLLLLFSLHVLVLQLSRL
ncbi:hypothetical protein QAD02_023954, partial [Eretmocerus hayati]